MSGGAAGRPGGAVRTDATSVLYPVESEAFSSDCPGFLDLSVESREVRKKGPSGLPDSI